MSNRQISIAIDAMGGDNSPIKILKGAEIFSSKNENVLLNFFGDEKLIKFEIKNHNIKLKNYIITNTENNVLDDDNVTTIIKNRKESSIFKGLEYVKANKDSGFVSAGNTAALMILSRLILGMIEGIDRPAICSVIPNRNNYSLMLDLGANVNVNPINLFQFALMGYSYYSIINNNPNPKIGIINIGTENNKGLDILQEATKLIENSFLKKFFIGFVEPDKITLGECDIMISDGYTGNIILKTAEGMSDFITFNLKKLFKKSILNKIIFKTLERDFIKFKEEINPEEYNGATLIGINGISVKSHGSASPYSFSCALDRCYGFVKNNLNFKITETIKEL